jgi:hypothetical protein
LPVGLGLGNQTITPPPKAAGAKQRDYNYSDDRHPSRPADRELRNQEKDGQYYYAGDYEDGGETHVNQ